MAINYEQKIVNILAFEVALISGGEFMATGHALDELEKRIGYVFQNKALLKQALTHSSYANEQKIRKNGDYERLEFLGDAVLELISS